jgi:glycosyltransferase involved in cell wall biosynthesis
MEFSIVITTYQRRDGSTPFYLKRAIDSVFNQDYNGFKILVIGDRYEDNEEFLKICSMYDQSKIYYENLPIAHERDKYEDKNLIWKHAGCYANNYGVDKALEMGYEYVCHLDHDDFWEKNHLSSLKNVIEKTEAIWLCTKSKYGNTTILPHENFDGDFIEFYPIPEGVIRSSVCINYKKLPLRYRNEYEETGISNFPGDADFWNRISFYMKENDKVGYLINKITCNHLEEGYSKKEHFNENVKKYFHVESSETDIKITEESLAKLDEISKNMEGITFHKHTHILYDIRTKLGENRITYLEIGSYAGGSVSLISSHQYETDCFSVDIGFPILPEVVERNVNKFKNESSSFQYIQGSSSDEDVIKKVYELVKSVDLLFIDGDHSEEGAYSDFENYSKIVNKNGYICFDDYLDPEHSPGVRIAVDRIVQSLDKNEYEVIGLLGYDSIRSVTHLLSNTIFVIKKLI